MSYTAPANTATNFILSGTPYSPPGPLGVDFVFLAGAGGQFTPVPGLLTDSVAAWAKARPLRAALHAPWDAVPPVDIHTDAQWGAAVPMTVAGQIAWDQSPIKEVWLGAAWQRAGREHGTAHEARWQWAGVTDDDVQSLLWDNSIRCRDPFYQGAWNKPPEKDHQTQDHFHSVDQYGAIWRHIDHLNPALYRQPTPTQVNILFNGVDLYTPAYTPQVYFHFGATTPMPVRPAQPKDTGVQGHFRGRTPAADIAARLPWGFGSSNYQRDPYFGIEYPDYHGPLPQPDEPDWPNDQPSFLVMNTVNLVKLPERTPLDFANLAIGHDIDSVAWTISADILNEGSINAIKPDATGPRDVELSINGFKWVFMIDKYSVSHQFPAKRWRISGASRTQYLAAPYAPARSQRFTSAISAAQVITQELTGTGFTLNWHASTPDWTIDAGVYQYTDKTALDVVAEIAGAVGAVIQPSSSTDTITVRPRYPLSPWAWNAAPLSAMDNIIIESMVLSFSAQWSPKPAYNAAYVSGINAGRSVNVIRSSTAGDKPAPDTYHVLNLDDQQCIERGRNILSDTGAQEIITLDLPLPPSGSPGLVLPGNLIEYRDAAEATQWRGLVLSSSIRASGRGATSVVQSVQIERHH